MKDAETTFEDSGRETLNIDKCVNVELIRWVSQSFELDLSAKTGNRAIMSIILILFYLYTFF